MSISFRVMRLHRPQPHADTTLKLDLLQDTDAEATRDDCERLRFSEVSKGLMSKHLAQRTHAETYSDLQAPSHMLALPSSFGSVFLGETFRACVVASSMAAAPMYRVAIKVELSAERHSAVLFDSSKQPVQELAAGGTIEAVIKQDIKGLGPHTLTCSATFTSDQGDRTFYSQAFKFASAPPLTVRTKVRAAGPLLLLEACVDNGLKGPLLLHSSRFLPAPGLMAQQLQAPEAGAGADVPGPGGGGADAARWISTDRGPLDQYIRSAALLPARGSHNLLYGLTRTAQTSSEADGSVPSNVLGRIELHWSGLNAEAGRLQTQPILGTPASLSKLLSAELLHVPARVLLEQPFSVQLQLANNSSQATGPLTITAPKHSTKGVQGAGAQVLQLYGTSMVTVPQLQTGESAVVELRMLGLQCGYMHSPALLLQRAQDGQPLDCVPEFIVLVEPAAIKSDSGPCI